MGVAPDLKLIEEAVQNVLDQEAVELVDLRYAQEGNRAVLRFYMDKAGGFTLDDCERMSNRIGGILDMTDLMAGPYVLEVSSPGTDRVLKRERDFARFAGHRVKLRLKAPREGRRNFSGYLKGFEEGKVILEDEGKSAAFPLEAVDEARLNPDIDV